MTRSRIAIDVTPLLYTPRGIGRTTRRLVKGIVSAEPEFELVAFGRRLAGPRMGDLGLGIPAIRLRLPRMAEPWIARMALFDRACKADLYHCTDFYSPLRTPEKAVCSIHDVIFMTQPEAMVDHVRLARMVPPFAARCRGIITISEHSKREIVKSLGVEPAKVHVTYLAADRSVFSPGDGNERARRRVSLALGLARPFFLGVSCSTGRKNTALLLDAYRQLALNGAANDLVLLWSPPEDIRAKVARGPLARRVHLLGRQPDESLADLYRAATALVFPSLNEGFGLPVLEAMACGTPVICSGTTSLPEVGGDAPFYVDPSSTASLVAALESFENRRVDVDAMRTKGLVQADRFSWDRCVAETLSVYRECLTS